MTASFHILSSSLFAIIQSLNTGLSYWRAERKENKKLWEELNACFPLIWHGPCRKACPAILLLLHVYLLPWQHVCWTDTQTFFWYDTYHAENDTSNNSIVACMLVVMGTCLPSHCQETLQGDSHTDTADRKWSHRPTFIFSK
jgi:hypothetical protein